MDARILQVASAVKDLIYNEWADKTASDSVNVGLYVPNIDRKSMTGRKVYVFPLGYSQVEVMNRAEDKWEYEIGVVIVEKCTDAGEPSETWVNTRINWVQDSIVDRITNHRDEAVMEDLTPISFEVDVFDPGELSAKVFYSTVSVTFHKVEQI